MIKTRVYVSARLSLGQGGRVIVRCQCISGDPDVNRDVCLSLLLFSFSRVFGYLRNLNRLLFYVMLFFFIYSHSANTFDCVLSTLIEYSRSICA